MWYLRPLERAGVHQKLTILERKNGLVLANSRVPVSGTWSLLSPKNYLYTIALVVYIYIRVIVFPIQFSDVCSKMRLIRKTTCDSSTRGKCSRRSACVKCDASVHVILPALVGRTACKMFCFSQNRFSMLFLLNLFKNLNLCTSYIKQIMNVFSFVQWNKYFHSVKDEIYHSTRLRLVEWNISSFFSWKYLYHCTHKHSLLINI